MSSDGVMNYRVRIIKRGKDDGQQSLPPSAVGTDDKCERHNLRRMREHGGRYAEFHRPSVEVLFNLDYAYEVVRTHLARKIEAQGLSLGASTCC
jgi:hypothetical protein